jgi:two-component system, NtrC family, response regulator AtoC
VRTLEHPRGRNINAPESAGRFRVLAIDDQAEVLKAVGRLLRTRGFDVCPQNDPLAALAELEANPFGYDLVMLDISMPRMSGLEVLPRVRALAPDVPVIMLTADTSARSAVTAMKAGAYGYLTKPLDDPDAVALTLSRAASYNSLQRRARELRPGSRATSTSSAPAPRCARCSIAWPGWRPARSAC